MKLLPLWGDLAGSILVNSRVIRELRQLMADTASQTQGMMRDSLCRARR